MPAFYVKSLPLKEVIESLAKSMNTTYGSSCNEYFFDIPPAYGNGTIRGINFSNGFGLIEYHCFFKEEVIIHFSVNNIHPLKFIYCSNGSLNHRFEEKENLHEINQYQNVVVSSTAKNGHILIFPKGTNILMNSLEISRKEFKERIDCEINELDKQLKKLFKDTEAKKLFFYHGNYSLSMADCIYDINTMLYTGFARRLFLEGKANEIMGIQIKDFEDDQKTDRNKKILRKSEMQQIRAAAELLKEELSTPITVVDLAKRVGTNATKLQEGFNYLYRCSVNVYLKKLRIEFAREQLILGELNISQIAEQAGLVNKSYFSKLFKITYGVNPKEFSKQLKRAIKSS